MRRIKDFRFTSAILILIVYCLIGAVLFAERSGIRLSDIEGKNPYLPMEQIVLATEAIKDVEKDTLVLVDMGRTDCAEAYEQFERIFLDMKVGYDVFDLGENPDYTFDGYAKIVVVTPDMTVLSDRILELLDYVRSGGNVFFTMTMENSGYATFLLNKAGAQFIGDYTIVDSVYFDEDFMVGGGRAFGIEDGFDSALAISLTSAAKPVAWTRNQNGNPLIWSCDYGEGRFVVANLGFYEKVNRGIYAAAYSLMDDVCVYPVINGTAFYIDDMPSPVPSGDATFITRDYHMDISSFYSRVWLPDIQNLSRKYGYPITAVMIENYDDDTSGRIIQQADTGRFSYYGNLFLKDGGELGYHGYNHQPLMPSTVDYGDAFAYNTWESREAMENAVKELMRFGQNLFPLQTLSVYVPPSNILSLEGREVLKDLGIKTIASTYLVSTREFAYTQEFEVAADGIIEQPRVVSGAIVDDYFMLTQFSELNMHYVATHFMHPDDTLDEDRGAELGWATLCSNLDGYLDWLFNSADSLRRLTGSELSGEIQRYSGLTASKSWLDPNHLKITLGNFIDEASLFIRFNENEVIENVTGASLTHLCGNLYLMEANSGEVTITFK